MIVFPNLPDVERKSKTETLFMHDSFRQLNNQITVYDLEVSLRRISG